jgi:hypothetical protein
MCQHFSSEVSFMHVLQETIDPLSRTIMASRDELTQLQMPRRENKIESRRRKMKLEATTFHFTKSPMVPNLGP